MLGTVCGQALPEREMRRDVGEGSSVRPGGPGTNKVPHNRFVVPKFLLSELLRQMLGPAFTINDNEILNDK